MKWTNSLKDKICHNHAEKNRQLNRPKSIRKIELIMNNLPKEEVSGLDVFTTECY